MADRTNHRDTMVAYLMTYYAAPDQIAAVRGGVREAAALCDAIAREILAEHRVRNGKGKPSKLGVQLAAVATRCGDDLEAVLRRLVSDSPPASGERG